MTLCVICRKEFEGEGHDARPIRTGICCDVCYFIVGKTKYQNEQEKRRRNKKRNRKVGDMVNAKSGGTQYR